MAKKLPVEQEVHIDALSKDGLGAATLNERPLWVRNALPGERVQARILKRRGGQRFADGQPLADFSHKRVTSACQYFPRCAGCNLHHLAYGEQLQLKQFRLVQELQRVGVTAAGWRAPSGLTRLGYRRKARLGVRVVGEQVLVGFRESFSNRVARLDGCMTLTPRLSALLQPLKRLIANLSQPRTIAQIEMAEGDSEGAILVRHLDVLTDSDLEQWQQFANGQDVQVILQPAGYDSLQPLPGQPSVRPLSYGIAEHGLSLQFYAHQFTQVNALMNRELIRVAIGYLGDVRGRVVADLFCGIGNFSLPLARQGARVLGVEASAEAISMAEVNARRNGLAERCYFRVADLYSALAGSDVPWGVIGDPVVSDLCPEALIIDPPRSGAGVNLEAWVGNSTLWQIVYVSCNPQSFADDALRLHRAGFQLREVGIYDMFPQTAHVETIGHFVRAPRGNSDDE